MHSIFTILGVSQAVMLLAPVLVLLCWLRNMMYIGYASIFANISLALGLAVIIYYGLTSAGFAFADMTSVIDVETYPLSFGIYVAAFEGINLVIYKTLLNLLLHLLLHLNLLLLVFSLTPIVLIKKRHYLLNHQ